MSVESIYANVAACECPRCHREFLVHWFWETENLAYISGEDGEVVTEAPAISGSRVAYERHVTCPTCGAQLRVSHELVPEFYATARVTREEASDGEGQD